MTESARPLRADAQRNRGLIIDAASEVFARSGIDAPVQNILDLANVGAGTLYRRFPTRTELVEAVLEEKMIRYADVSEEAAALAETDPGRAFTDYAMYVFEAQAADPAFAEVLVAPIQGSPAFREHHSRGLRASVRVVELAQQAGILHPDIHHSDFYLMQVANGAVAMLTRTDHPDAWRRFAAYALRALSSQDLPLPPVPDEWDERLKRTMSGGRRTEDGGVTDPPSPGPAPTG